MSPALAGRLPDFPWDSLAEAKRTAAAHPDGLVDLSVGTPVDPTPGLIRAALEASSDAPGYPATWGTPALRTAIIGYLERRWAAHGLTETGVLPVIGTKELVALLPLLLGVGPNDTVVIPSVAYPTYQVGAQVVGAQVVPCDDPARAAELRPALIWINSPANPHGAILSADQTRAWVDAARSVGAVLAADECYGEFGWTAEPVSVLDPAVNGGSLDGLLAVHSLSKRSNLAGYRAGFVAGDPTVVGPMLEARKNLGLMLPTPVQAAMVAALDDAEHVAEQRERYLRRRALLAPALVAAGYRIEHSEGSLYLWCTRDEDCRASVAHLAGLGILVAPGDFYGQDSRRFVRVALTATDERIAAAAARLHAAG
ncbi:succinyldiaminopimelate aminotransferase [Propionicimonas paludicola]|uniref:Aminotransferase n=1 Tax=Propionicimonas paludicola TaxID=185243 RepID=A0A2A9CUI1_9ACTN|nr:succinyldiaminopimelate transaminase [Propionicimonas paludicola]PFG17312.1 succinyldiaminopimelate aminotransferase [Propionicimonas paludicola]